MSPSCGEMGLAQTGVLAGTVYCESNWVFRPWGAKLYWYYSGPPEIQAPKLTQPQVPQFMAQFMHMTPKEKPQTKLPVGM